MSWTFSMSSNVGTPAEPKFLSIDSFDLYLRHLPERMFYEAFGVDGIRSINHVSGAECAPLLDAAIKKMKAEPEKYRGLGGNYEEAIALLEVLHSWCEVAPGAWIEIGEIWAAVS